MRSPDFLLGQALVAYGGWRARLRRLEWVDRTSDAFVGVDLCRGYEDYNLAVDRSHHSAGNHIYENNHPICSNRLSNRLNGRYCTKTGFVLLIVSVVTNNYCWSKPCRSSGEELPADR